MRPAVTYTPCATSLRKQTGNIIMYAQFEEGIDLINEYNDQTTPNKLATGTKPSVSHICVLCCPCVV